MRRLPPFGLFGSALAAVKTLTVTIGAGAFPKQSRRSRTVLALQVGSDKEMTAAAICTFFDGTPSHAVGEMPIDRVEETAELEAIDGCGPLGSTRRWGREWEVTASEGPLDNATGASEIGIENLREDA